MSPALRKIVYAVSFELIGILVAGLGLKFMSGAETDSSLVFAALSATLAMVWSYLFNSVFEAWEARQPSREADLRPPRPACRAVRGGLTLILLPLTAWWFQVGLLTALWLEAGLIVLFLVYTWVFTWSFDRLFGLPQALR
ncbi:MAG: PACE efflux transporter [Exiguobacterium profundum]|nr:MAG: PACE efflux transporter [Exiguobacterium profundum]